MPATSPARVPVGRARRQAKPTRRETGDKMIRRQNNGISSSDSTRRPTCSTPRFATRPKGLPSKRPASTAKLPIFAAQRVNTVRQGLLAVTDQAFDQFDQIGSGQLVVFPCSPFRQDVQLKVAPVSRCRSVCDAPRAPTCTARPARRKSAAAPRPARDASRLSGSDQLPLAPAWLLPARAP
jgi:hypothetical protein